MNRTSTRARIAIGSAVMAVAGFAAAGSLAAATESSPPSTPPGSEEPAETAVDSSRTPLDPARDTMVDQIIDSAGDAGFPLDRECVAGLVAQIPDEDLELIGEQIAGVAESATATAATMAEYPVMDTQPAGTDLTGSSDPLDTTEETTGPVVETLVVPSQPALSPETEAIGEQMILCTHGDADPALVAEAVAVIESDEEAPDFDMACVASVLTTFSDETLTLLIEDGDLAMPTETAAAPAIAVETVVAEPAAAPDSAPHAGGSEPAATEDTTLVGDDPLGSFPEESLSEAFALLACAPDPFEAAPAETAVSAPTESTIG